MRNKIRKKLLIFIGGVAAFVSIFSLYFLIAVSSGLPDPELLENRKVAQSTKIYDRTGETLLYEIHGEEKRTIVPFEEIPERVKQATIAIEDANFYKHPAFDWKSIIRAILVNISRGRVSQGGSTITQQLAKNAFLSPERTITRKIKELALAIRLEKKYSKDEILNLYLNQIPYGSNAYGIEAAAQTFFKKKAKDLNLAEAALLASLPKAPSYYSPYGSHQNELLARKDYALDQMAKLEYINDKERDAAKKHEFSFAPSNTGIKAPHFIIAVQEYLNNKYGEDFVRTAGLEVITSLDWNLQQAAEKIVFEGAERNLSLYQGHNAALVAQDASTGQILVMVGSKDYFGVAEPEGCKTGIDCRFEGNFNVASQGLRQPGSAIKPFAYATAFKNGYTPDTVVFDLPTEFVPNNPKCPLVVDFSNTSDECYHPQNFDEKFRGPVKLRVALGQSINVPAAKVLYLAGIDNMLKLVKDFGITTLTERSRYGLSLVLGGGEIKLSELVGAYSVFAQDGIKHKQTMILKITDSKNRVLEEYKDQQEKAVEPQYARLINNILSDVEIRSGLFTGSLGLTVFPNQEVAMKTGTTNDYKDAWTFGYTNSLVVGVWAGNNDNTPMRQKGSSLLAAVPIWSAFMSEILKDRPPETFIQPDPVIADHPMLNGKYAVDYQINGTFYPQVHEILYYFNQKSAQFENWEEPVIEWAKTNIPNFLNIYNKPIPGSAEIIKTGSSAITVNLISPVNGGFINGNTINISVYLNSESDLSKIEVRFNDQLMDTMFASGKSFNYQKKIGVSNVKLQNKLKITAYGSNNTQTEKEIILFSN